MAFSFYSSRWIMANPVGTCFKAVTPDTSVPTDFIKSKSARPSCPTYPINEVEAFKQAAATA